MLVLNEFIGKRVVAIDELCPVVYFEGNAFLTIECCWRLRANSSILVGYVEYKSETTHDDTHKELEKLIMGKRIKKIIMGSFVSDLFIEFEDSLYFELYNDSSIYESWSLTNENNHQIIALPGGGYSE